jgi:hypothetical protein
MAGNWIKLLRLPLLVVALGAIYRNPYPLLNRFGGRLENVQPKVVHQNHEPLNNDKCWTNSGPYIRSALVLISSSDLT